MANTAHGAARRATHVGESLRDSHETPSGALQNADPHHSGRFSVHPRLGETRPRAGFTLVELLIAITIIGILAGLILGVASVAGETARHRKTEQMIARLHTLLTEHYDTYKTRRVALRQEVIDAINSINTLSPARKGQALAEARLYALREMILMEVPDRWSDILLTSVGNQPVAPLYLYGRTDLSNVYLRRYLGLLGRTNTITGQPNTADELRRNQGAECLYLVITLATGDGEARSMFGESTIGDSDGDGAKEFLDGWERPINFLRWAPGFDSQVQINANRFVSSSGSVNLTALRTEADADHDPFDIFRADPFAFRLVPLIYSPGPDEDSGLFVDPDFVTWRNPPQSSISIGGGAPFLSPRLSPYTTRVAGSPAFFFGTDINITDPNQDRTYTDNIHNHLMGDR